MIFRGASPDLDQAAIAKLAAFSRSRVGQLHQEGRLPAPDGAGSTDSRPRWQRGTVLHWLVSIGRRPAADQASWLIPGPDGPHLRRDDARVLVLRDPHVVDDGLGSVRPKPDEPRVHVATYVTTDSGPTRRVWLVTPVAPTAFIDLTYHRWTRQDWPPVVELVHQLVDQIAPHNRDVGKHGVLGTLAVLRVQTGAVYPTYSELGLHVVDVLSGGSLPEDWLLDFGPADRHPSDLVQALGHPLPRWFVGCATADLVSAWSPEDAETGLRCEVPPPIADSWRFRQQCEQAATLADAPADGLRVLGAAAWSAAARDYRPRSVWPGADGFDDTTPTGVPLWTPALTFEIPDADPVADDSMWDGLDWIFSDNRASRSLTDHAHRAFGDPDSFGVVTIDLEQLPPELLPALTVKAPDSDTGARSHRARAVVDVLAEHHHDVQLGVWDAPTGPRWCARSGALVAFHIPTQMPDPKDIGDPLDIVFTHDPDTQKPLGLVHTTSGAVAVLNQFGDPSLIAGAIELTTWHPGQTLSIRQLSGRSTKLADAISGALSAGTATVLWRQLQNLVGPHPETCGICLGRETEHNTEQT